MRGSSWTQPDESPSDPMLADHFQIAIDLTRISPNLRAAARDVLVDGLEATKAAARHNVEATAVNRAVATVRERWELFCVDQGCEYVGVLVPKEMMPMLLEIQRYFLRPFLNGKGKARKKKT